eukprot:3034412-Prymnesium_polylepis.1
MCCQVFKCYAKEIGCRDGINIVLNEKGDLERNFECNCIEYAFDPFHESGDGFELCRGSRRPVRGHRGKDGLPDRPCGRALECTCCEFPGGPYIPMCPFRACGVSGMPRGDLNERLRGWLGAHEGT